MNLKDIQLTQAISLLQSILSTAVGLGLMILIFGVVAEQFGWRIPFVPAIDATKLAYISGAWWLYKK